MFRFVPPPAALLPWLEGAVVLRADVALHGSHFPAMAASMLVVRLEGEVWRAAEGGRQPVPAAAWMDPSTRPVTYAHAGAVTAVGLIVRLAAAGVLCCPERAARTDGVEPARQALGPHWDATEHALRAQTSDEDRLAVLWAHVAAVAERPQAVARLHQRTRWLEAVCQGPVAASAWLGVGPRQAERRFRSAFGMTPKQYQTIARLKHTLHEGLPQANTRADLAAMQGYYDQSHLGREVRRLLGQPLARAASHIAHPPDGLADPLWPLAVRTDAGPPPRS